VKIVFGISRANIVTGVSISVIPNNEGNLEVTAGRPIQHLRIGTDESPWGPASLTAIVKSPYDQDLEDYRLLMDPIVFNSIVNKVRDLAEAADAATATSIDLVTQRIESGECAIDIARNDFDLPQDVIPWDMLP
jgi:hypothetical protein